MPSLGAWLALRAQRSELLATLRALEPQLQEALSWNRPRVNSGSVTVSVTAPSPPVPEMSHNVTNVLHRTLSAPRSCAGALLPRARSPLRFGEIPTPIRAGSCSARSVSLTRVTTPVKATGCTSVTVCTAQCATQSWTPLPQKPAGSPPACSIRTTIKPPRSASAAKMRQESSIAGSISQTPRSSSCIRTRTVYPPEFHAGGYYCSAPLTTVSAVPVVSAMPVGAVLARGPVQRLDLEITVRPLSPSSGRVRQAPPSRRVRSIENLEAGKRPISPTRSYLPAASPQASPSAEQLTAPWASPCSSPQEEACGSIPPKTSLKALLAKDAQDSKQRADDTIFGEAAKSWGKICLEMAKTSEEDFDKLQVQLNSLNTVISDEKVTISSTPAKVSESCA